MTEPKIFLSYDHEDQEWARGFAEALRDSGVSVWLDQWELKPGDKIREALEQALLGSDTVVFLLGAGAARSANVFFELGAAVALNKRIIPILAEDLDRSEIPMPLLQTRYVVRSTPKETAREVLRAVA